MYPGQNIVYIIFREHDLGDLCEVFRFILPQPENFRCRKARKSDVGRPLRQLVLANDVVQVVHLPRGAAIVPENGGTNHTVVLVQHHQAVHLASTADSRHIRAVKAAEQLGNSFQNGLFPVLRVLLAPARSGEFQRILLCYRTLDIPGGIHQQKLHRRGSQIDSNVKHIFSSRKILLYPSKFRHPITAGGILTGKYFVFCPVFRQRHALSVIVGNAVISSRAARNKTRKPRLIAGSDFRVSYPERNVKYFIHAPRGGATILRLSHSLGVGFE